MVQWMDRSGRFCFSGVEVLRCRISLPQWEEDASISMFYRDVADRAYAFCETTLRTMAESAFEQSEDEKKRFRFPTFLYTLDGQVTHEDERFVSVRLEAVLRRRGTGEMVDRRFDAHTWQWEAGGAALLPPKDTVRLFSSGKLSRKERRRAKGVLIADGRLWLCDETGLSELAVSQTADSPDL